MTQSAFYLRLDAALESNERYREQHHAELEALIGALIIVDPEMGHDVRTSVVREPREFAVGYRVEGLVIGPDAWVTDILVSSEALLAVWRHNVLADRLYVLQQHARAHGIGELTCELEKFAIECCAMSIVDTGGGVDLRVALPHIARMDEYKLWA